MNLSKIRNFIIPILVILALIDAYYTYRATYDTSENVLLSLVMLLIVNLYILFYYPFLDLVKSDKNETGEDKKDKDNSGESFILILFIIMMFGDTISSFYGTYISVYTNSDGDLNDLVDIGLFQFLVSSVIAIGASGATYLLGRLLFKYSKEEE